MTIEEAVIKDFTKDGWAECPLFHLDVDIDDEFCRVICPIKNICESAIKYCADKRVVPANKSQHATNMEV